jgi:hypothetical protein
MRRLTRPGARRALNATALAITLLAVLAFASSASAARKWLPPQVVSNPANPVTDVDVAMDRNGNTLVTWSETISGSNIIRASYRPAGGAFGPAKSLSAAGASATQSHPAFDGAGNAIVVWLRNNVIQFSTRPAGGGFSSAQDVSNPAVTSSVPEVEMAPNGQAFIVFISAGVAQLVVRHPGGQRDPPVPLSAAGVTSDDPVTGVQLAVNAKGDSVYTWDRDVGGNRVIEGVYRPAGAATTPSPAQQLSTTGVLSAYPAPALDPQGRATIVWESCPSGCSEILSVSRQAGPGQSFTAPDPIITGGSTFGPSVAADSEGSALAVWINGAGGSFRVQTSFRPVNSSYQGVTNIGTATGNTFGTGVHFDPSDNAIAVFNRDVAGGTQVQASLRPKGQSFGGVDLISATGVSNEFGREPKLGLDSHGNGVVAYFRNNGTRNVTEVAGYDAAPPSLGVNVPGSGTAGQGIGFSASATDVWSAVGTTWNFGDGGSAVGSSVGHTYSAPGTYQVSVTARDALGNAASTSRLIQIGAPPTPPPPPPPPTLLDSTITNRWIPFPKSTKVFALAVNDIPAHGRVQVQCKTKKKKQQKKGCPFKSKTFKNTAAKRKLNLTKRFKKRKLPVGTKVTITITATGFVGKRFTYTMRKGKVPKTPKRVCILTTGKPGKCP